MQEKISFNETVFFDKIKIALQRLESDTDAKLRSLMTSEANSKTVTDFGDPIKKFKDIVKIYGINGATVSKKDFPDEIYAAVMQRVVAVEAPKFSGGSLNEGYIIKQLGAYISDLLDTKTETITVGNKNYTLSNPIGSTLSTITVTVNDAHYVFSWNDDATARKSLNIFMKNLAEFEPLMAAEDIFIDGSIPVDLPKTKKEELTNGRLDLIVMYAIGSGARQKTESAGKIALGIKESLLKDEQLAAYKSLKYLLFHYWKNPQAYALSKEPVLVDRKNVPSDYLLRMEKDAVKFLLLEYNPMQPADLGNINILKTQRRGNIRYLPFVTTLESITE